MAAADQSDQVLRHVVLFSYKPTTSEADKEQIAQAFAKLPSQIDEIIDFEWGSDVSVEGIARGYNHCFIVTFRDAVGRDAYLPHPAHKAFGDFLGGRVEQVLVIDYWARR